MEIKYNKVIKKTLREHLDNEYNYLIMRPIELISYGTHTWFKNSVNTRSGSR